MVKNKFIVLFSVLLLTMSNCFALTLDDLTTPQPPAYRLGTGDTPENAFKVKSSTQNINEKEANLEQAGEAVKNITYADLSLKKIAKELSDDGELIAEDVLKDVQLLWIGAAQNSQTVKFIVYKLSNPDEDKPDNSIVKKIVKPIATVGSVAGIGIGNPIAAVSSIMGSSVLSSMTVNDKDLNYKFSKVNDADMVVLIRKIEELQQKIITYYWDYMTARQGLIRCDELVAKRRSAFTNSQGMNNDQILMLDSFYRSALNKQAKLRGDFLSKRSALEQIVGMETLAQFEDVITERETQTNNTK